MNSLESGAATGPGKTQVTPPPPITASGAHDAQSLPVESRYDDTMGVGRAAALLKSIPAGQRPLVNIRWVVGEAMPLGSGYGDGQSKHFESLQVHFDDVDLLGNVASFVDLSGEHSVFLPLDQIKTIWRKTMKQEPVWEISIVGSLHPCDDEWQLWPPS